MDASPEITNTVKQGMIKALASLQEIHDDFFKTMDKINKFCDMLDVFIDNSYIGPLNSNCFEEAGNYIIDISIAYKMDLFNSLLQCEKLMRDSVGNICDDKDMINKGKKKLLQGDVLNVSEMRGVILSEKLELLDNRIGALEDLLDIREQDIEPEERHQVISESQEKS